MASFKSNASYNTLLSLHKKLTCLNGVITPEAVNRLEDELSRIFTVAKTHHLTSAIPKPKYRLVIRNATWIHTIPADPGTYSMAALAVGNAAALCEQYVAEHKILMKSYNDYLGIEKAGKELILYAAGNNALAPFKKQCIGFWQLDGTLDDGPSTSENCNQDDNSAEVQVQGHRVQQPLGSNHKHHCVLHAI
jgi:hypothetical protein